MKKIDREMVEYVARLSRIELTEAESERFTSQLERILEYVDKLNELDTVGVEPMAHVPGRRNVLRADEVSESLPCGEVLANAPDRTEDSYRVPKIIQSEME